MNQKNIPRIGLITSVNIDQESREVRLNVLLSHNSESREVLFLSPHRNLMLVPDVGEYVLVQFIEGEYKAHLIDDDPLHEIPSLSAGDVCITLDEETALHFSKQEDGTIDIKMSASGDLAIHSKQSFQITDADGYGIVSDGSGNFTWHHEDVNFDSQSTADVSEFEAEE